MDKQVKASNVGDRTYQGNYTFVHHDATTSKAVTSDRVIRSHVHGEYKGWRRLKKTSLVVRFVPQNPNCPHRRRRKDVQGSTEKKESTTVKGVSAAKSSLKWRRQLTESEVTVDEDKSINISKLCPLWYAVLPDQPMTPKQKASATTCEKSDHRPVGDPVTFKGNSDPFNSLAVPVGASVSQLLGFARDYAVNALYGMEVEWRQPLAQPVARRDWNAMKDALHDPCSAYVSLTRHAAMKAAVASDPQSIRELAIYRSKAIPLLRLRLKDEQILASAQTKWQINVMLMADTVSRDIDAARAHAAILQMIFQCEHRVGRLDIESLGTALFSDVHGACISLNPPVFEVEGWVVEAVDEALESLGTKLKPITLPQMSKLGTNFDSSIDEKLKQILVRRRRTFLHWSLPLTSHTDDESLISQYYSCLICSGCIVHGQLINYYLNTIENIRQCTHCPESVTSQAYLSIAALYISRKFISETQIGGVSLFSAESKLLSALRRALSVSMSFNGARLPQGHEYAHARLWALYVGAFAEHRQAWVQRTRRVAFLETEVASRPEKAWFNIQFAAQAWALGFGNWSAVESILETFLHLHHLQPHGSIWFEKTMATYLSQQ